MDNTEDTFTVMPGDIFLCSSTRIGARIVKFLMEAPTIWIWLARAYTGHREYSRYYHAGMVLDIFRVIEQEWKVQIDEFDKLVNRKVIIYRKKSLTTLQRLGLAARATLDIGEGYDLVLIIGKTLTWFTGIKWFVDFLGGLSKQEEICINRVCLWYKEVVGETFGAKNYNESTTKTVDKWCSSHPEEWQIVYEHS
jgi:hypothetical protein